MNWSYQRKVRYYETDRMGVVHHSNYLRFLEDARMDWLDSCVMPYSELEAMGIIIPAVSAAQQFRSYLRFGDTFRVQVKLVEYTGVRMRFSYEVRNVAGNVLCLTAETEHYFSADKPGYPPISIKRKFPELHNIMLAALEQQ